MKKIFILALNIALAGSMCSCSDFLDREPKNTVDPETTVDEDVAVSMANACYRTLQSSNMYNQRLWTLDIVAGNSIVGAGGGTDGIDVTALGYDLSQCTYESNFDATINNGPESIFEVQFSGNTEYDFWGNNPQSSWLSTFMGPRNSNFVAGSYGWNLPTEEFMSQYEEGDKRKDLTVLYDGCPDFDGMTYKSSYSTTGYNVRKFLVSKSVSPEYNTNPANFVVYRYADVLLMKAEALNEQGKTAEAAEPLNIVRHRAGLPGVSGLSQEAMREKIIHERRIELAFEGHRWFDMIRLQHGDYAVKFLKSIGKSRVTKERLLFPIPQTERDANKLMTQNPGY